MRELKTLENLKLYDNSFQQTARVVPLLKGIAQLFNALLRTARCAAADRQDVMC